MSAWAARARTRMKWVGIRLEVQAGDGVLFVANPSVLAGVESPDQPGSLRIVLGNRVRFAPGVVIEAAPGRDSVLEVGDGARVGANTHFHLHGGKVRIGASSELRDDCLLETSGGVIELEDRCFMSYGCVLRAGERIAIQQRVAVGDGVRVSDSGHDGEASDGHWDVQGVATEPVVVGADTVVFANAVITRGSHIGSSSQVAAASVVSGEHPDRVLLAGVPARVVKPLDEQP